MKNETLMTIGIILAVIGSICWIVESALTGSVNSPIGDFIATTGLCVALLGYAKDVVSDFTKKD